MIPLLIEFAGEPIPMPRAGRNERATYMPRGYMEYRDTLSWTIQAAMRKAGHKHPFEDPLEVMATFVRSTRNRVDLDNLLKTVLDAGTGVVWTDDSQIFRSCAEKVLGAPVAGTTLRVEAVFPGRWGEE